MKHDTQKGAVSGLAIAFIAIIIIALIGIGWMWKKGGVVASGASQVADASAGIPNTGSDGYTYSIATSTTVAAASDTASAPVETHTVTTYETKTVPVVQTHAVAATGVSGAAYHNATYGLTLRLPSAGWTVYQTTGGPAGLPGTAQLHFVAPGESQDAFVINVWDKAGWNYVRTQENFVHLNTTNIGEGTYLGENFTWIYSYTLYSHPEAQSGIAGAVFY